MIVTCLIGDPVEHSLSNYMYNYFAKKVGLNYGHVKFKVSSKNRNNLKIAIQALKILGINGANITIPYKVKVMRYLDKIDKTAKAIGAVNTIINKNNKLIGYNTDGVGAIQAIEKYLREIKPSDQIVVFGAGGVARVVVFELSKKTKKITVLNRTPDFYLAQNLRNDFIKFNNQIEILPLNDMNIIKETVKSDFVINATSVGMFPNTKESLLSKSQFAIINTRSPVKNKYFFDVVYPHLTKFLSIAKEKYNAKVCPGLYMTIYQGIKTFKLWTEKDVPENCVNFVYKLLKSKFKQIQCTKKL